MDAANRILRSGWRTSGGMQGGTLNVHGGGWWWLLPGLAVVLPGGARALEGVILPARVEVADVSEPLVLNGAGARCELLCGSCVAGPYLPTRGQDAVAVQRRARRPSQTGMPGDAAPRCGSRKAPQGRS